MFRKALVILTITAALLLSASVLALAGAAREHAFPHRPAPDRPLTAAPHRPAVNAETPDEPTTGRGERPAPAETTVLESRAPAESLAVSLQGIGGGPFETSLFFDDLESGLGNWTASGLWHATTIADAYGQAYNGSGSAWYGQPATGDYNTGGANSGALVTGPISIPADAPGVYLRYYSYEFTEDFLDEFDTRIVYTSTNGLDWSPVFTSTESTAAWHEVQVDLSGSIGQSIYLKFEFDTVDDSFNTYPGWYIDDVAVGYDTLHANNLVQINYTLPGENTVFPDPPYRSLYIDNLTGYTATFTLTIGPPFFNISNWPVGNVPAGENLTVFASTVVPDTEPLGAVYDTYFYYTATTTNTATTYTAWQLGRTLLGKLSESGYQIYDDGRGQTVGNGDGRIDPGETISLTVDLQNYFDIDHFDVTAGFGPASHLNWSDSLAFIGDFPAGSMISNTQYLVDISESAPRGEVLTFTLNTTARGGLAFTSQFTETIPYVVDLGRDQLDAAPPGETITYTLEIANQTGSDDAFDLTVLTSTWPTNLSATTTPVVPNGATTSVEVYVEVPPGADWGDLDPISVQAAGVGPSAAYQDTVLLRAYAGLKLAGSTPPVNGEVVERTFPVSPFAAYLYIFSGDDDTLDALFEGYNPASQAWEPIASQTDGGSGVLFDGPLGGSYQQVRVRLWDTDYNDDIYLDYFFVHAPTLAMLPVDETLLSVPGRVVTFTQQLSNLTGDTYSYVLTATLNNWPVDFLSGTQVISHTPVLADGEAFTYTVAVAIPADPGGVLTDTASLLAQESQDYTYTATARVNTRVLGQDWALGFADLYDPVAVLFDPINGSSPTPLSSGRVEKREVALSAFNHAGNTAAAWERTYENNQGYWVSEVVVALVDADGELLWGPVLMSDFSETTFESQDQNPSVAIDPTSGNIGLAWEHYDYSAPSYRSTYNIHAAVLDPQGNILLPPTPLTNNNGYSAEDYGPIVEAFRSGGFGLVWEHWPASTGGGSFYSHVLDSQGNTRRASTELLTTVDSLQPYYPRLVRLHSHDELLLVYNCYNPTSDVADVCVAPMDRTGTLAEEPRNLTMLTPGTDYRYTNWPDGVQLESGEIVVGWVQEPQTSYQYLVLDADLNVQTPSTALDTGLVPLDSYQMRLSLAQDSYGRAVYAYTNQAFSQIYDEGSIFLALIQPDGSQLNGGLYRQPQDATTQMSYNGQAAGGMAATPLYYQYMPAIVKPELPPIP
jgi:hypothetical protein